MVHLRHPTGGAWGGTEAQKAQRAGAAVRLYIQRATGGDQMSHAAQGARSAHV